MANLRRLIDLDKIKPIYFPSTEMDGLDVVRYLETLPTVDAVEVVRCKDCTRSDEAEHGLRKCELFGVRFLHPHAYCAYGERRTDG